MKTAMMASIGGSPSLCSNTLKLFHDFMWFSLPFLFFLLYNWSSIMVDMIGLTQYLADVSYPDMTLIITIFTLIITIFLSLLLNPLSHYLKSCLSLKRKLLLAWASKFLTQGVIYENWKYFNGAFWQVAKFFGHRWNKIFFLSFHLNSRTERD